MSSKTAETHTMCPQCKKPLITRLSDGVHQCIDGCGYTATWVPATPEPARAPELPTADTAQERTIEDYVNAPYDEGPLAYLWRDKKHRVLLDLCDIAKALREQLASKDAILQQRADQVAELVTKAEVAEQRAEALQKEVDLQKGANAAQDERERNAAQRLGMVHNCDWPDDVADRVEQLTISLRYANDLFSCHNLAVCDKHAVSWKLDAYDSCPECKEPTHE